MQATDVIPDHIETKTRRIVATAGALTDDAEAFERVCAAATSGTEAAMLLSLARGLDRGLESNAPLPHLADGG